LFYGNIINSLGRLLHEQGRRNWKSNLGEQTTMKYTTKEIREAVINVTDRYHHIEDWDRTLIINTLDAAFKRLLPDVIKSVCPDCKGTGDLSGKSQNLYEECKRCNGDGSIPDEQEGEHHYRIIKGDEVNSFHSAIMRELDVEGLIALRDKLIRRTPDRLPDDTKTMADDYKDFKEHGIIKCGKCGSKIN
jgi:hypothetical protein